MKEQIKSHEAKMQKTLDVLSKELAAVRAGRANPAVLDKILAENPLKGEYFLPGVVDRLLHEGKADVKVLRSRDRWYGVTYKEDKESVVNALQSMKDKGEYPDKLWK